MSNLGRLPLILNPRAKSEKRQQAIKFLMDHLTKFAVYATRSEQEAKALAKRFAEDDEKIVVAAGGDGTLNAVVQGLSGSQTALGILPTGTMNVFARELGIPANSLERAMQVLEERHIIEVDLFEANTLPFIQMAGVGFDAQVIEETPFELKKKLGPLAYLVSAMKVLGDQPPKMTVVLADGQTTEGVCVLVGNGTLYGGQFRLFGKADNRDELLDVVVFKEAGYFLVRDSLMGLASGGFSADGGTVEYFQTKALTVRCDREVPLELDGDACGRFQEVNFCHNPTKLEVVAPKNPEANWWEETLKVLTRWNQKG